MTVKVDGIGLNAKHFAAMSEEAAVADMTLDKKDDKGKQVAVGVATAHGKDAAWAKGAYAACVKAVKEAEKSAKK